MRKYFVYKITNLINNKIYIGKTYDVRGRLQDHKKAAKRKDPNDYSSLHRAMNKYGYDNFIIEVLAEFKTDKEALKAEVKLIKKYNSMDRKVGYNLTCGGDGASGFKFTKKQKAKMNKDKKEKYLGEGNPFFGKRHTAKAKKLFSKKRKEKYKNNKKFRKQLDDFNISQCSLTLKQCLEIQKLYLTGKYTYDKIDEYFGYNYGLRLIYNIIHGTYAAIKGHSILTEEKIKEIKHNNRVKSEEKKKNCQSRK